MRVSKTKLEGVLIIEPDVIGDSRGWFMETYNQTKYQEIGIDVVFIQDNQSYSSQLGILRGLHFQNAPKTQSKLVRCTRGRIFDVAVDLRKGSVTFKQWVSVELSEENKKQLFIPQGFGHGFLTLSEDAEVQYKVDQFYSKEHDRSIRFDDPDIDVEWPSFDYILSQKDIDAPLLKDSDVNFIYKKEKTQ
jgi:dTDP-4-dehydrorhamnose reductase/dTDP-4-dehydrorhamnose 3,5-epimerase